MKSLCWRRRRRHVNNLSALPSSRVLSYMELEVTYREKERGGERRKESKKEREGERERERERDIKLTLHLTEPPPQILDIITRM